MPKFTTPCVSFFLLGILVLPCVVTSVRADGKDASKDEELLKKAGIRLERDALLEVVNRYPRKPLDVKGLPALIKKLSDESFEVREGASQRLIEAGDPAYNLLQRDISNKDPEVARRARICRLEIRRRTLLSNAAMHVLVTKQAPGSLEALFRSPHQSVRWDCARQLEQFNDRDAQAITLKAIEDEDPAVARAVRRAVYGALRFDPLPTVLKLADSSKPRVRAAAMFLLAKFVKDPASLPVLLAGVKDKDVRVRRDAAFSLGGFPTDAEVVKTLCALLEDPDPGEPGDFTLAEHAAWSLAPVETLAELAIPALAKASRDGKGMLRFYSFRSLGLIGKKGKKCAEQVLPHLVEAMKSDSPQIRAWAAGTVGELGAHGAPAVDPLLVVLQRPPLPGWTSVESKKLQTCTLYSLGKIGPAAKTAVPVLIRILEKEQDRAILEYAIEALGEIGPDAKSAIPSLQRLAKERDPRGRNLLVIRAAEESLKKIAP